MDTKRPLPQIKSDPVANLPVIAGFPASEKIYVADGDIAVPVRRIQLTGGEPAFDVYDTSGPQGIDPHVGLPKLRKPWIEARKASANQSQMHFARQGIITPEMKFVDVVDADASNRASLLFELRAQSSRQFVLYRVIAAEAQLIFVGGSMQ